MTERVLSNVLLSKRFSQSQENMTSYACLERVLLGPTGLGWLSWLDFFTCSTGNQPFSVGLVDQLFQPTRSPVELVEKDGYRPLSQSWALIRCAMLTNAILFNTVEVWCLLSPGIRPCFQLFQPKRLKCVLLVHFNPINQNRFRLKRLIPIEHDLNSHA